MNYKSIDMFCGCGGLSLGLENAGFDVELAIDYNEKFLETYKHNHKSVNVKQVNLLEKDNPETFFENIDINLDEINVVSGGPPCKGFSMAGNRDTSDERNGLIDIFLDYAIYINPDFIFMENVPGLSSMTLPNGSPAVDYIENKLKNNGYEVHVKKLDASDYGVPQKRKRLIFIGHKKEYKYQYPDSTGISKKTVSDALSDLDENSLNHDDTKTNHSQEMKDRIDKVNIGESLYDGYSSSWKRIDPNKPSPTIKHNNGAPFIHPHNNRVGTVRECARIQSFPDNYEFVGSKSIMLETIGNAVPPKLSENIGYSIIKSLNKNNCNDDKVKAL